MKTIWPFISLGFFAGVISGVLLENRVLSVGERAPQSVSAISKVPVALSTPRTSVTREIASVAGPTNSESSNTASPRIESSAASGPAPTSSSIPKETGTAKIVVDIPEHDFGEAESGTTVEHAFTVKNSGDGTLRILRVVPGCGCTVAKMAKTEIAPGSESQLSTKLSLSLQKGPQRREIVLETNDAKQPKLQLILKGKAVPRVALTPARLDLNGIDMSKEAMGQIKVTTTKGLKFNVLETKTSGEDVTVKVDVVKPAEEFNVTIRIKPSVKPGDFHGWVHLITDQVGEYRRIGIPVTARVRGPGGLSANGRLSNTSFVKKDNLFTFAGPTLDGRIVTERDFRGRPAVVFFWASWCPACNRLTPDLKRLYDIYHAEGVEFVGISVDSKREPVQTYASRNRIAWPIVIFDDREKVDGKAGNPISKKYHISQIPSLFVLDADGMVVAVNPRGAALESAIDETARKSKLAMLLHPLLRDFWNSQKKQ